VAWVGVKHPAEQMNRFSAPGYDHEDLGPEEVMAKVLEGVRVLEMGTFITGPAAGMLLGDLGADVVKIEHPEGDPFRAYKGELYSPHFQTYNRNKRSIRLNTKEADDLRALDQSAQQRGRAGVLEVERQRAFVAVDGQVVGRLAAGERRPPAAGVVAEPG